jgi:hypothetical protein
MAAPEESGDPDQSQRASMRIALASWLAPIRIRCHISVMAKQSIRPKLTGKAAKASRRPKVVGVTKDGVRILASKGKATHFTAKEIREAVAAVRAARIVK